MTWSSLVTIDRRQNTPFSVQLANQVRYLIFEQKLPTGSEIPTAKQSAKELNIPMSEVDKAYHFLVEENLIRYDANKHPVVVFKNVLNEFANKTFYIVDTIKKMGMMPSIKTFIQETIEADATISQKLEIEKGSRVLHTLRTYYGDGKPMILLESFFPLNLFPGLEAIEFGDKAHFKIISSQFGVLPKRSVRLITVANLTTRQAQLLKDVPESPCHTTEVWTYDTLGRMTDYNISVQPSNEAFESETKPEDIQSFL